MLQSPFLFFTDAVLRAPTIGCMLMCLAASLVGVIVFLRKESLLGESLSHAAYPGIIAGALVTGLWIGDEASEEWLALLVFLGAFSSAFIGLKIIAWLETRHHIRSDSALTFVLASFMGIGITLASHIQFTHATLYRQSQNYLFGQAATMTDQHVVMYGSLALFTIAIILALQKELQLITFDRAFAKTTGIKVSWVDFAVFTLVVLAVVLGLRSVGVVLMSAMFIAPPVAARQYTHRFSGMLVLAGIIGLLSGFLGNYLSVELSDVIESYYPSLRLALPTGPMIILVACTFCFLSLLIAPERGLLRRLLRIGGFRYRCVMENTIKCIWRFGPRAPVTYEQIHHFQGVSNLYLRFVLIRLIMGGWVVRLRNGMYRLTKDGRHRAARIVRLHRLWELYLADQLGLGIERVHRNAEEMEHILTPEIEEKLTQLLNNPKSDPHDQPIPPRKAL